MHVFNTYDTKDQKDSKEKDYFLGHKWIRGLYNRRKSRITCLHNVDMKNDFITGLDRQGKVTCYVTSGRQRNLSRQTRCKTTEEKGKIQVKQTSAAPPPPIVPGLDSFGVSVTPLSTQND